jgi:hypothetical protein
MTFSHKVRENQFSFDIHILVASEKDLDRPEPDELVEGLARG